MGYHISSGGGRRPPPQIIYPNHPPDGPHNSPADSPPDSRADSPQTAPRQPALAPFTRTPCKLLTGRHRSLVIVSVVVACFFALLHFLDHMNVAHWGFGGRSRLALQIGTLWEPSVFYSGPYHISTNRPQTEHKPSTNAPQTIHKPWPEPRPTGPTPRNPWIDRCAPVRPPPAPKGRICRSTVPWGWGQWGAAPAMACV